VDDFLAEFFKDEPMGKLNKALMTFAGYNAGPGRVRQLRRETEKRASIPTCGSATSSASPPERIGRETVTSVSNIYKYYTAYRLWADQKERRDAAEAEVVKRD